MTRKPPWYMAVFVWNFWMVMILGRRRGLNCNTDDPVRLHHGDYQLPVILNSTLSIIIFFKTACLITKYFFWSMGNYPQTAWITQQDYLLTKYLNHGVRIQKFKLKSTKTKTTYRSPIAIKVWEGPTNDPDLMRLLLQFVPLHFGRDLFKGT